MEVKEITIAGQSFNVRQPYAAGHVVTDAEAKALNQVRAENIRNNMATKVKTAFGDAPTEELNVETIGQIVAEYDAAYEFTLASVGGGRKSADPVESEARKIATAILTQALRQKGTTLKAMRDRNADAIEAKIAEIAERADVVKQAKANVKAREAMQAGIGDLDLDLGEGEGSAE